MPALERAAAGRVRAALRTVRRAELVWADGCCAVGIPDLEPAPELGPGVAAGPLPRRLRTQLAQVRIEGTMPGGGQAPVRLPYPHQRAHEVATAPPRLEARGGVARAQPHGDAVPEPHLLGAPPGP